MRLHTSIREWPELLIGPASTCIAVMARLAGAVFRVVPRPWKRRDVRGMDCGDRAKPGPRNALPKILHALLSDARLAIRLGFYEEAQAALQQLTDGRCTDGAYFNLLGVLREVRQDWKSAKKFYRRAVWEGRSCAAARQNIRRLYELNTFGWSSEHISLGDERPALAALLKAPMRTFTYPVSNSEDET